MSYLKLVTLAALLSLAAPAARATSPSAYSDADLYLTSTSQSEISTATATSGASFADSMAQPGLLQNSILAASSFGALTSFETQSVSSFNDTLTISNPLYTGQPGTLAFSFLLTGTENFSAVLPGESSLTLSATVTGLTPPQSLTFSTNSLGVTSGTPFLDTLESFSIPFTFGDPFHFGLQIDVTALDSTPSSGAVALTSGTFATTVSTGAVTALVEGVPQLADNSSVHTASGATYFDALPIPEPDPIPLVALSLLASLGLLRPRRRRVA